MIASFFVISCYICCGSCCCCRCCCLISKDKQEGTERQASWHDSRIDFFVGDHGDVQLTINVMHASIRALFVVVVAVIAAASIIAFAAVLVFLEFQRLRFGIVILLSH